MFQASASGQAKYEVRDVAIATMFFKTLVGKTEAQTVATTSNIRKLLSGLKEHIVTVSYDITVFNEHVNGLLQDLNGYGQDDVPDLTVHLFDAYLIVPDKIFKEMIGKKHTDYLLGTSLIDHEELMTFATTAFNVRKGDLSVPWLEKSEEQQQIEALTAELDTIKKTQSSKPRTKKTTPKTTGGGKKKGDEQKSDKPNDKWAWKEVQPKDGEESKVKRVNGKDYHWCPYHKAWTIHTAEQCKLKDRKPKAEEEVEANEANVDDDDDQDSNTGDDEDVQDVLNSFAAAVASE